MNQHFFLHVLAAIGLNAIFSGTLVNALDVDTNTWQYEMLKAVNDLRAEHKKPAVGISIKLQCTAQIHAEWMAKTKTVEHYGPEKNTSPMDRAKRQNFTNGVSENIGSGILSATEMVSLFKTSSGHFENIIADFKCAGFGRGFDDTDAPYWCQNFGTSDTEDCKPPEKIEAIRAPPATPPTSARKSEEDKSQCIITQTPGTSSTPVPIPTPGNIEENYPVKEKSSDKKGPIEQKQQPNVEGPASGSKALKEEPESPANSRGNLNANNDNTSTWQYEMLKAVNEHRHSHNIKPFGMSLKLQCAAQLFAEYMASIDQMGHFGPNGIGPGDRVTAQGFIVGAVAENAGADLKSASEMVWGWSLSKGHNENMLRDNLNCAGFGRAFGKDMKPYWCQVFGASDGENCPPPETISAISSPPGTPPGLAPGEESISAPIENTEQCVRPPSSGGQQSKEKGPPLPPPSQLETEQTNPSKEKESPSKLGGVTFKNFGTEELTEGPDSGTLKGKEETAAQPEETTAQEPDKESKDEIKEDDKLIDMETLLGGGGHC